MKGRSRLGAWARTAAFLGGAGAGAVLLFAHAAQGALSESALEFGRGLAEAFPPAAGPQRVTLNGESIFVAAHTSSRSVAQVLRAAERDCRSAASIAVRRRAATSGMVGCVVAGQIGRAHV